MTTSYQGGAPTPDYRGEDPSDYGGRKILQCREPRNNTEMNSRQNLQVMNYEKATKSETFPKRDQAIVLQAIEGFTIKDYVKRNNTISKDYKEDVPKKLKFIHNKKIFRLKLIEKKVRKTTEKGESLSCKAGPKHRKKTTKDVREEYKLWKRLKKLERKLKWRTRRDRSSTDSVVSDKENDSVQYLNIISVRNSQIPMDLSMQKDCCSHCCRSGTSQADIVTLSPRRLLTDLQEASCTPVIQNNMHEIATTSTDPDAVPETPDQLDEEVITIIG
ncbi:hypothetical protein WN55_03100 [Dufourea novaeangliae]|uniref:Uncharacterized protein n=1 Tax=Dufourea novaeangliae TaxID=178035 RepID=A0A154PHZ5_DUFNO|nr:hypothetical protein WN55_03100 [Dufourea novaeangliae]